MSYELVQKMVVQLQVELEKERALRIKAECLIVEMKKEFLNLTGLQPASDGTAVGKVLEAARVFVDNNSIEDSDASYEALRKAFSQLEGGGK